MTRKGAVLLYLGMTSLVLSGLLGLIPLANAQTQIQVYGLWHCSSDACSWAAAPNMTTFDTQNHWIIDRGNGSPSVNLVVLSFVNRLKLMNLTTDSTDTNGDPQGHDCGGGELFREQGRAGQCSQWVASAIPKIGIKLWGAIPRSWELMRRMQPSNSTLELRSITKKAVIPT